MTRRHRGLCAAIALASLLWATACGVKGPPLPPQEVRPERVLDLEAQPIADGIRLTWSRPERYTGGQRMRDLGKFAISRAEAGGPLKPLVEIPVTDRERFRVERRFSYIDAATVLGQTYRYEIVAMTTDGYRSVPSNDVSLTRIVPPPPPNPNNFTAPAPTPIP